MKRTTQVLLGAVVMFPCVNALATDIIQWKIEDGGNGHWYQGIRVDYNPDNPGASWEWCKEQAELVGGYLATITSSSENEWIKSTIVVPMDPGQVEAGPQIGGWKIDGQWQWITGEAWDFEGWGGAEPTGDGDRLEYWRWGNLWWNDSPGTWDPLRNTYVVEYDSYPLEDCNGNGIDDLQDIANGTSSDCNDNGIPDECDVASVTLVDGAVQWTVENGGNDHWYGIVYVGNGSCWNDVRVEAESYGGHLATITSQEEQDFLEANIYDSSVWMSIGGYQDLNDPDYSEPGGGWKWVTGEPMDYTHWYSGSWGEMPWDDNPPTHHWMQVGMTWWNLMWKTTVECSDESHAYIIEYDNLNGTSEDCNGNGIPDECELESNDCNNNGIPDECDIANGTSPDVNPTDGVPDECQGIPNGACCIGSQCIMGTEISCTSNGGDYLGNGIACSSDSCGTSGTGACCLLGTCIEATLENCFVSGGSFAGIFATCNETNCPSSCLGDVNNDGTVQIDDLLLLIGAWGACP